MEEAQAISGGLNKAGALAAVPANVLFFDDHEIRAAALEKLGGSTLFGIFFAQLWTERWLRLKKQVNFRKRHNEDARQAYCQMNVREFEGINARQQWSNWRTIPRNLSGAVQSRPVFAVDLCCGVGHSTDVLAHYLPQGSRILGLEYNSFFIGKARSRAYLHANGARAAVSFRAQSVLETFRDERGEPLAAESVDVVNSCGAVGCHFDPRSTELLAREVARVLRPGGVALIDSGSAGTSRQELERIFGALGFRATNAAKSCLFDLYTQIRLQKL